MITCSEFSQGVFAVAGFPADLAPVDLVSVDEQRVGELSAGVPPGADVAVATHASRLDHPSPCRAANCSHTSTSRRPAIRHCTNSNGGLTQAQWCDKTRLRTTAGRHDHRRSSRNSEHP